MKKLVRISNRIDCGRYGRVVAERAPGYTEIDVGRKTGRLPALENENHIILVDSLYEEVDAIEIISTVNTAINDLIVDAQRAGRWMNDNYEQRDLNRNRVNYGVMTQALRTLRALGYDTESAVWGDGDFLICEKITINGKEMFKR